MTRFTFAIVLVLGIAAAALLSQPASAQSASTQVVFSGTGSGAFNSRATPFGFWICVRVARPILTLALAAGPCISMLWGSLGRFLERQRGLIRCSR
jgi:hypothetical protein